MTTPVPTATVAAAATAAPTATSVPAAPQTATAVPTPAPPTNLAPVQRDQELITMGLSLNDPGWQAWSRYTLNGTQQKGIGVMFEPTSYYDALSGKSYPWLASSWSFNSDATKLTYQFRPGIFWRDGVPFTASDAAYTFNTLKQLGSKVANGSLVQEFLSSAKAVSTTTLELDFSKPAPLFNNFVAYNGDDGIFIVPQHIFQGKDWTTFNDFDLAKGWPIGTSPWKVVYSGPNERIMDRVSSCDQWWACKTGLAPLPKMLRWVQLGSSGSTAEAEAVIKNQIDQTHDMKIQLFPKIFQQNPKVTSWTGQNPPYGMTSWWPLSLVINDKDPHLSNPAVRWAISYSIDRTKLVNFAYGPGFENTISQVPWPPFAGLKPFTDSIQDLLKQYPTDAYDPSKAQQLLTSAGYHKDSKGIWADSSGSELTCNILGFAPIFSDIGPVLAQELTQAGIKASYSEPTNAYTLMTNGNYTCAIFGHTGAQSGSPFRTLNLYTTGNPSNFYGYANSDYDKIVAQLGTVPLANQSQIETLTHQAMAIWLKDLPDVQLVQFLNRPALNTTYWTNWPTAQNDYMNGLFLHDGFAITLDKLQPTGK